MIESSSVIAIGKVLKPHGIDGEMAVTVSPDLDWTEDMDCLVCSMDGILVPFFLESVREKSATTLLVKFQDVDTIDATARFIGVKVYMPRRFAVMDESDAPAWSTFIDWEVVDSAAGSLGHVKDIDDSTANVLLLVSDGDRERMIPANPDWIESVDEKNSILKLNLPEGLADL